MLKNKLIYEMQEKMIKIGIDLISKIKFIHVLLLFITIFQKATVSSANNQFETAPESKPFSEVTDGQLEQLMTDSSAEDLTSIFNELIRLHYDLLSQQRRIAEMRDNLIKVAPPLDRNTTLKYLQDHVPIDRVLGYFDLPIDMSAKVDFNLDGREPVPTSIVIGKNNIDLTDPKNVNLHLALPLSDQDFLTEFLLRNFKLLYPSDKSSYRNFLKDTFLNPKNFERAVYENMRAGEHIDRPQFEVARDKIFTSDSQLKMPDLITDDGFFSIILYNIFKFNEGEFRNPGWGSFINKIVTDLEELRIKKYTPSDLLNQYVSENKAFQRHRLELLGKRENLIQSAETLRSNDFLKDWIKVKPTTSTPPTQEVSLELKKLDSELSRFFAELEENLKINRNQFYQLKRALLNDRIFQGMTSTDMGLFQAMAIKLIVEKNAEKDLKDPAKLQDFIKVIAGLCINSNPQTSLSELNKEVKSPNRQHSKPRK